MENVKIEMENWKENGKMEKWKNCENGKQKTYFQKLYEWLEQRSQYSQSRQSQSSSSSGNVLTRKLNNYI